ncbi:hypothetical protein LX36DRAFT_269073 [Colletotrichum falcatum]|nr:hypothetical protein LX36DRAFT_269073 [Colletotrichum falcatum]
MRLWPSALGIPSCYRAAASSETQHPTQWAQLCATQDRSLPASKRMNDQALLAPVLVHSVSWEHHPPGPSAARACHCYVVCLPTQRCAIFTSRSVARPASCQLMAADDATLISPYPPEVASTFLIAPAATSRNDPLCPALPRPELMSFSNTPPCWLASLSCAAVLVLGTCILFGPARLTSPLRLPLATSPSDVSRDMPHGFFFLLFIVTSLVHHRRAKGK